MALCFARLLAGAGALLAAAFVSSCATAAPAAPAQPAIVAIGDLHGDYDAYIALMQSAGLVDAKGRWTGGKTIFVQTGDIPDRGPQTRKIIDHLMKIEKAARRKGGAVIALVGNHEAMNVTGDLRYVVPGEYAEFATRNSKRTRDAYYKANSEKLAAFYRASNPALTDEEVRAAFDADAPLGYLEHRAAWRPAGAVGAWIASHDAMRVVGDTLFLHGGVSADYVPLAVAEINERVRAALMAGGGEILTDERGPLWYRGNIAPTPESEAEVAAALAAYGVKRIVVGHTPQLSGIAGFHGGRVVAIDTGISRSYGGAKSYLKIGAEGVIAVNDGVATKIGER